MASLQDHLNKLRQDRIEREKARIEKLKEMNIKKYGKTDPPPLRPSTSNISFLNKSVRSDNFTKNISNKVTNNDHGNGSFMRPISAPMSSASVTKSKTSSLITSSGAKATSALVASTSGPKTTRSASVPNTAVTNIKTLNKTSTNNLRRKTIIDNGKTDIKTNKHITTKIDNKVTVKVEKTTEEINTAGSSKDIKETNEVKNAETGEIISKINIPSQNINVEKKNTVAGKANIQVNKNTVNGTTNKVDRTNMRKTMNFALPTTFKSPSRIPTKVQTAPEFTKPKMMPKPRKSMQPIRMTQSATKPNPNRQTVFERLYQPKIVAKKPIDEVEKIKTDPNYLKKIIKKSELIYNKRHTVFEEKKTVSQPVRRSISAVHFKRIAKSEMSNCIKKWSSIGEKLDEVHLKDINEDESVKEDKVVSAVKSERKKVKFQTPNFNFHTPKPEEMQQRLQNWLQKRGKSINSYQHLQCFGINHLSQKLTPLRLETTEYDEENKENLPLDSDTDNESFEEMNVNSLKNSLDDQIDKDKWRRASNISTISTDFNDSHKTHNVTLTPSDPGNHVNELLLGALNDLTELLHEGFDWDQCARWLRAIRYRFPSAPESAAYWECRAALEEKRGNLPTSIKCWEEAIAKGTESSVVEANLDQLLDKFMQLQISPNSGKRTVDPKMVDIKNVFKSTIIRFAVQQAKLRQSTQTPPKYICTPVRRSGRLSTRMTDKRTPLVECSTLKQAGLLGHPLVFVPNDKLCETP